jgi:hypothetical protein
MISKSRDGHALVLFLSISACGGLAIPPPACAAGFDAAAAFNLRCSGCHSVGNGVVVGPDLRGVTARHNARWLHAFIRSSQTVIRRGDPAAVALFAKYKKRMPDHDLTDREIDALLAFIAAGGPRRQDGEYRQARMAKPADVARGRGLFMGDLALTRGGAACGRCHAAGNAGSWRVGTLASDLAQVYLKYRDGGLTRALTESRFPLMRQYRRRPLTSEETFAIKAFLYQAARSSPANSPVGERFSPLARLTQWLSALGGTILGK